MDDWTSRARCRFEDPDLFFPTGTSESARTQLEEARRICQQCAVRRPCLDLALATESQDGMWGGTTPNERRRLRRGMRRQPVVLVGSR
ncbi:WhiB family transcriptional regulator [Nocardioides ginsengisoli]|uniref:Transcriptional regulator WhiB n=3 Tax=Nocardioides TaxID=1839 RepID=A0A852RVS5_9ACTN|nr:WhiB family transcriptional regulator [Nocardioides kongjuensis]NYD33286.1 WhiB family redox-sensing transcriptional regulator [Nocardioides kongjuensis]